MAVKREARKARLHATPMLGVCGQASNASRPSRDRTYNTTFKELRVTNYTIGLYKGKGRGRGFDDPLRSRSALDLNQHSQINSLSFSDNLLQSALIAPCRGIEPLLAFRQKAVVPS